MSDIQYFTQEGYDKLIAELKQLKSVERPSISRQIAEAREKGDLSENAEYDAAKEAQALLEVKIAQMEDLVARARVLDDSEMDNSKVLALSKVKIKNHRSGKEVLYQLVSEKEANLKEGKISVESPIGKGLLGKSKGDVVEVKVPAGLLKLEVLEISR